MTRILSVFNLLKRVGFAFAFLVTANHSTFAEWGNEVVLWRNQEGITSANSNAEIAIDSEGRAHIAFSAQFVRNGNPFPRYGLYYCRIDTLGNMLEPVQMLTDSNYYVISEPKILLFEPDSILIMVKSLDSFGSAFRYFVFDFQGNLLHPIQEFAACVPTYANGWSLNRTQDRLVVLTAAGEQSAMLNVIVQEPNGSRPIDCEVVWNQWPCDQPVAFIDNTDSLQLFWRQYPSWAAVYGKRLGVRDHIPLESVDDFWPITPNQTGYARGPFSALALGDSQVVLLEWHFDSETGIYFHKIDRATYETVQSAFVGLSLSGIKKIGIVADTVLTAAVRATEWYGIVVRGLSLTDMSLVFESDSLWVAGDSFWLVDYAASSSGRHHVVYNVSSNEGIEGQAYLAYRVWQPWPFLSVANKAPIETHQFTLFPNPANGDVYLKYSQVDHVKEIVIHNILGQRILSLPAANAGLVQIHAGTLSSGIYFVNIVDGTSLSTSRLIIQK